MKTLSKRTTAVVLSLTILLVMLAVPMTGLLAGAADTYGVTVGFDPAMVNDNGTVYLPLTTEDGKAIMDTYGDWTTAFGTIYVDGAEWPGTGYSITGNYFYMGGLGMNSISKIEIKAGTELTPDATCLSATPIIITNDLTLVKTDGVWAVQADEPAEAAAITLSMSEVQPGDTWVLSADDMTKVTNAYYRLEVTVDGTTGYIAVEKSGDNLVIWPSFFSVYGVITAAPTASFAVAEGALLEPVDPNTTGWNTVIEGDKLAVASAIAYEKSADGWGVPAEEPVTPLDVELTFNNVNVNSDWAFTYETTAVLPTANQWYVTEATVDGENRNVLMEYDVASSLYYIYHHCFAAVPGAAEKPAASLKLAEGAILTPISSPDASAVIEGGQTYKLTAEVSVALEDGVWKDTNAVPPAPEVTPLDAKLTFDNINTASDWAFTVEAEGLPTANAWYAVPVQLDGTDRTVLMEYDVNAQWFYVYHHCFWPTPNDDPALLPQSSLVIPAGTVLTPLSSPDMSAVIEGGQTYQLTAEVSVALEDGVWKDTNAVPPAPPVTVTPLDAELTFNNVNVNSDWAFTVEAEGLPTANAWYAVPVKLDGTDRTVLMEYDVNAQWFYVYHHCFWPTPNADPALLPQSNLTIPAGTVLTPISSPDMSAVIEGGQTYQLTKAISVSLDDGEWVDDNLPKPTYTDLTVDKMTVVGQADQPAQMRSYFQLSVVDTLPQAGAEWWNDYDVYDVTVTVDGKDMIAALGGGGDAAVLALYIPWATAEDDLLANASEIIVKAGSKGRVGLEGVSFPSDLRIYKENGVWKTAYDPSGDVDLSNAVSVGVAFDHIDGANHVYLSALLSDGGKIMDIYGDWTTAYGSIRMGSKNADGTYTWAEDPAAAWSISGSYFYMSAISLDLYDAIEIKKGTVLLPDASCKSQNPIIIANDFRMVRDEWDEWVVDDGFTNEPDYTVNSGSSVNTGDTNNAPIAWIVVGVCAAALAVCVMLGTRKKSK